MKCIGKDGIERNFIFSMNTEICKNKITFYASFEPIIDNEPRFYLDLEKLTEPDAYKIVMIDCNNDDRFCKKGIPDSLLPRVADYLQTDIISSTGIKEFQSTSGEIRYPEATKMWERLKEKGIATYCKEKDIYTIDYRLQKLKNGVTKESE